MEKVGWQVLEIVYLREEYRKIKYLYYLVDVMLQVFNIKI